MTRVSFPVEPWVRFPGNAWVGKKKEEAYLKSVCLNDNHAKGIGCDEV